MSFPGAECRPGVGRERAAGISAPVRGTLAGGMLTGLLGLLPLGSAAAENGGPPWLGVDVDPTWNRARSVLVEREDAPLKMRPSGRATVRGSARKGARLPFFGAVHGHDCSAPWLLVGSTAWLCGDDARLSTQPTLAPRMLESSASREPPLLRFFVGDEGALAYRDLATAERGAFDGQLDPGLGIGIKRTGKGPDGYPLGLTTHDLWVPLRDLIPAAPSAFAGVELDHDFATAWVGGDATSLYRSPHRRSATVATLRARQALRVLARSRVRGREWLRVGPDTWVRASDVTLVPQVAPPTAIRARQRWIDVHLETQSLTLYEGERAVFTTLVSTGRAERGELATPKGEFRVWVKLASHDMDNLDDPEAEERYGLEAVPWVMFFERGYGLHGTFWHDDFGRKRSHGCVNLSVADAKRVFDWASPRLHSGWSAALPTPYEPGTLVRVR